LTLVPEILSQSDRVGAKSLHCYSVGDVTIDCLTLVLLKTVSDIVVRHSLEKMIGGGDPFNLKF